jgi:hypothetical protein
MHIGIKDGDIVIFGETQAELEINALMRGITLDSVEETDEEIVPYYNTQNDGYYFKKSEVPPEPAGVANEKARRIREGLYGELSDPITNKIAVLRDEIDHGEYGVESESEMLQKLADLYNMRKAVRQRIVDDNPYVDIGEEICG